jgi:hypothetical protein
MGLNNVQVPVDINGRWVARLTAYNPQTRFYPAEIEWDVFNPDTDDIIPGAYMLLNSLTHRSVDKKLWDELKQQFHYNYRWSRRSWARMPELSAESFVTYLTEEDLYKPDIRLYISAE